MQDVLLTTKLYIPPVRSKLVSRTRLIDQLNAGLNRKLTLVSAPAGFGKTTLIAEWITTSEQLAAWLQLDEGDNDQTRFLTYLVAALQQINPSIGKGIAGALQSPQPPPSESILTTLVNDISAVSDPFILVLDDYHLVESEPVDSAFTFLLDHLPPQMHLIMATRHDPQLPLARLRGRGQLTELRAADLRFTSAEAAEFLNQVMGLDLASEDIASLESRTEGWITGLQLAAISMQGSKDTIRFIEAFTGSHRYVLDYLIEEVLEQQTGEIKSFLLQTSILNRLCASLCDAVTGQENGRQTLAALDRANLFLVPLDQQREWYRYHHLFGELLRRQLNQIQPELESSLHLKASEWCEHNELINDSIEYALRAEDFERAIHLIERVAESLWWGGGHAQLRHMLEMLPAKKVVSNPNLCVYQAGFLFARGRHDEAERYLQAAEGLPISKYNHQRESLTESSDLLAETDKLLMGRIAATRSFLASYRSDAEGVIPHALQALRYLPDQETIWRGSAAAALGDAYIYQGRYEEAHQKYIEALDTITAADHTYQYMNVCLKLALNLRAQGKLSETIRICQQLLGLAIQNGISETEIAGWLFAIWGETLAELNDLDEAIHQARKGITFTDKGRDVAMLTWCYLSLTRVLFSRGDIEEAEKIINITQEITKESIVPIWVVNRMAAWQVRVRLALDQPAKIAQWMQKRELDPDTQSTYVGAIEYIALARILIAQNRYDVAARLLHRLLNQAQTGGHITREIELLILQSLNFQAEGFNAKAMTPLKQALTLGEPGGFIRTFVDEGPPMARLLYEALSRDIMPDYVRRLLAAFPAGEPEPTETSKLQVSENEWIEPLSERELEVLELVANGLTNREIGERLFLSTQTVKVHTRNIYSKLGVHNRMEAVARGRALGILPVL